MLFKLNNNIHALELREINNNRKIYCMIANLWKREINKYYKLFINYHGYNKLNFDIIITIFI